MGWFDQKQNFLAQIGRDSSQQEMRGKEEMVWKGFYDWRKNEASLVSFSFFLCFIFCNTDSE